MIACWSTVREIDKMIWSLNVDDDDNDDGDNDHEVIDGGGDDCNDKQSINQNEFLKSKVNILQWSSEIV